MSFIPGSDSIPPSFLLHDLVSSKVFYIYLDIRKAGGLFPLLHNKQTYSVTLYLGFNHSIHPPVKGGEKNLRDTKEGKCLKFTTSRSYRQLICHPQCLCIEDIKG